MKTLKAIEVFAVTAESPDDGRRVTYSYHSNVQSALLASGVYSSHEPHTPRVTLWEDENGKHYEITAREVTVDLCDIRNAALAKLSDKEKAALGLDD